MLLDRRGQIDESVECALIDELILGAERLWERNIERNHTNPSQLCTGYALSTAGSKAVPSLLR